MNEHRTPAGLRWLLNLAVVAGIVAVGLWGHATGWKLPSSAASPQPKEDWCEEHQVAESVCVECHPELMPRTPAGWCPEHGVHDCVLHHPELAQTRAPATVTPEDLERSKRALAFIERPANHRPCKIHERRVQFASEEAFTKAGVDVALARHEPVSESIPVTGEIAYDQHRVAHLAPRTPGTVWRVVKRVGERVEAGDVLCLIDSAEAGKAKAEYLQAVVALDLRRRTRERLQPGVVPEPTIQAAETALRESRIRVVTARQALVNLGLPMPPEDPQGLSDDQLAAQVQFLGVPPELVTGPDNRTASSNLLPLRAPIGGVIVTGDIHAGEVVDPSRALYEVVDTSRLWLNLEVRMEDAGRLKAGGAKVLFRPDGGRSELTGAVDWVSTQADPKTRTLKVRANLPNPDGRLRAHTFGSGRIVLREEPAAVVVPGDAIHTDGDCWFVFVRDRRFFEEGSPKVFHVRQVRPGAKDGRYTEIAAGLLPDEVVAARGSESLRGQLMRNLFGEGCCGGH